MPINPLVHLGLCIRNARRKHNLTQEKLAAISGLSVRTIRNTEKGRMNPSFLVLLTLVTTLKIPTDQLFYGEDSLEQAETALLQRNYYSSNPIGRKLVLDISDMIATVEPYMDEPDKKTEKP